ncbi:MAG TPA: cysteine desulfurase family protein [Flavobacterium sp.]|jgi:cysteine desulfurase
MRKVYLDNAATTQLRPEVIAAMTKSLAEDYGNPSSTHSFGRHAKSIIELSRKSVAKNLNVSAQEIIFTSGATESINWLLRNAIVTLNVKRIISSRIEHHAVIHAINHLEKEFSIAVDFVKVDGNGAINLSHLSELLAASDEKTLVSLMHVNNEIGTVLDLAKVSRLCKQYDAYFFSDTVQSVGKTKIDLQEVQADFIVASAHKFHGPKGSGFLFIRKGIPLQPMFYGGEQEKGVRPGTEAVHNVVGLSTALDLASRKFELEHAYIEGLRSYAARSFQSKFPGTKINGSYDGGFYNILNVCLPLSEDRAAMILFQLDIKGIAVSRGSACQSGSVQPSHVLAEVLAGTDLKKPSLRISFSHYNTEEDIDYLMDALSDTK